MRTIALAVLGTLALFTFIGAVSHLWWQRPNISVERLSGRVIVHTALLGEYPSDIGLIEVTEAASSKPIWRALPEGEMVQMHSFALKVGANDASPTAFSGRLRAANNGTALPFVLEQGVPYVVKVCAPVALQLCTSRAFMLS